MLQGLSEGLHGRGPHLLERVLSQRSWDCPRRLQQLQYRNQLCTVISSGREGAAGRAQAFLTLSTWRREGSCIASQLDISRVVHHSLRYVCLALQAVLVRHPFCLFGTHNYVHVSLYTSLIMVCMRGARQPS